MKINKKIALISLAAFIAAGGPFALSEKSPAATKKILFYRHPMRPDVASPTPAKDEMGMDYIPVYEEETVSQDPNSICILHDCPMAKEGTSCPMLIVAEKGEKLECPICKSRIDTSGASHMSALPSGYASVLISPQKQQLIGIRTSIIEKKDAKTLIKAAGRIAYDPELYQAQAEYIQSVRSLKSNPDAASSDWAKRLAEGAKTKLTRMGLNSQMIQDLEKEEGPDKSLLYAAPDQDVWVYANIYEYEIPLVKVGDVLNVETPSNVQGNLSGVIRAVDTVVDPATRTVRVRARIKNEKGFLKPDMYVNVSLEEDLGEIISVPEEAVFYTGTQNLVFVDKGNGIFEPRTLTLGQRSGGFLEVKDGLKEGERVVANGNFLLDSESRLKAALTGMK